MILAVFSLGLSQCEKDTGVEPREYDLCKLQVVTVGKGKDYYYDCFPKNSQRLEYEISIHDAYEKGFWGISDVHLGNVDKMLKEVQRRLESCKKQTNVQGADFEN